MKTSWASWSVAIPRSNVRVVCTLWETIATLAPTIALIRVDLPTLGAPIRAMKPQRRPAGSPSSRARSPAGSTIRSDRPFGADDRIDQGRFAHMGRTDQGDEAAAPAGRFAVLTGPFACGLNHQIGSPLWRRRSH